MPVPSNPLPWHCNIHKAIKRDYGPVYSRNLPTIRAFLIGSGAEIIPSLVQIVFSTFLQELKHTPSAARQKNHITILLTRFLKRIYRLLFNCIFRLNSLGYCFALAIGLRSTIRTLLERVLSNVATSTNRDNKTQSGYSRKRDKKNHYKEKSLDYLAPMLSSLMGFMLLQSSPNYRPTILSTVLPIPVSRPNHLISGSNNQNTVETKLYGSHTLDLTLFLLVRAIDSIIPSHVEKDIQSLFNDRPIKARLSSDVLIFYFSAWRIMWCWFYYPNKLPRSYVRWISAFAKMDLRILDILRNVRKNKFIYGEPLTDPGTIQLVSDCTSAMNLSPDFADPTKVDAVPCYLVHGKHINSPSCLYNAIKRWQMAFVKAFALYLPVHTIPTILFNRSKLLRDPKHTLRAILNSIIHSSRFLATFVVLAWYGTCLGRSTSLRNFVPLVPKSQQAWDGGLGPALGSALCGLSILLENSKRRGELALFVASRALYTLQEYTPQFCRHPTFGRWTERFIFSVSASIIMQPNATRGIAKKVIDYILKDEIDNRSKP